VRPLVATIVTLLVVFAVGGSSACGGHPPIPKRGVVEADLGPWKFKRFQGPLMDVEVWVSSDNRGEEFSASYITNAAEARGKIDDKDLVSVVVTRYPKPDGVTRATVKLVRRLAAEDGYQAEEQKIGGARTLSFKGHGEAWVMWPSNGYVVKVGGRGRDDVPEQMVGYYASRFPSSLPGGALEGPLPPGPEDTPKPANKPEYDPNNPHPDLDKYDPKKSKLPDKKPDSP
jgi:hypothetical protein